MSFIQVFQDARLRSAMSFGLDLRRNPNAFFAGMYIPKAHGTCVDLVQLELKQKLDFYRDLIIRLNSLFLITAEIHYTQV